MTVEYIRYAAVAEPLAASAHCSSFELSRGVEEPNREDRDHPQPVATWVGEVFGGKGCAP